MPKRPRFQVRMVDRSRWRDLVRLFEAKTAYRDCWCMFFRESNREFEQQQEERNRRRLKALVDAGEPVGSLAYDRGEPVGWASLGPRPTFERLRRSPLLVGDFADPSTWSLLCFYVHPDARRRGIAHALLDAA